MADNSQEQVTQFKQLLQEHVHDLKSDLLEPGPNDDLAQSSDLEDNSEESQEDGNKDISVDVPLQNDTINTDCLMLCGRILRIMGDEVTCRACGKNLRNIGDEIFCSYATRNILKSLLHDLSRNETVDENIR